MSAVLNQAQDSVDIDVKFPKKLAPLMEGFDGTNVMRRRYYVTYGGRDSGRSWSMARALLLQGMKDPLIILCVREVMKTIADSVHRLLKNQIELMGIGWFYKVQDATIIGANGCEFIFSGLRTIDAKKLKSYEGVDICMVEEAEDVSYSSWETLINTIRAPGSEIWVNFNPNLDTDETYKRFVTEQYEPHEAFVQKVTWADNPWWSEVLESNRLRMQKQEPREYKHIYGGYPRTVVAGAIYENEVIEAIEKRRIRPLPYDPKLLVHTIWDLGWNDQASVIFAQRLLSEVRVIDYEEASFLTYAQWAKIIKDKPYVYGSHWLPHDGANETQQGGGVSAQDQLKPLLGIKPKIIERAKSVEDPIRQSRMVWPRVYFDNEPREPEGLRTGGVPRLMECLKRFRRGVPDSTGEPGAPVKDEYRHGADAFSGMCRIVDKLTNDGNKPMPKTATAGIADPAMGM